MIKDFSGFENLLKLKETILNTVIVFDFRYDKTLNIDSNWYLEINSKAITCVFKESEWNFEQIYHEDINYFWCFSGIKPIKNSSYVILKMKRFVRSNLVIKERSWVDDWRKYYIDKLKKKD